MSKRKSQRRSSRGWRLDRRAPGTAPSGKPKDKDWGECESCGQTLPLVHETGMCGPCTFGEASTIFGDW